MIVTVRTQRGRSCSDIDAEIYFELNINNKRAFSISELCECPEDATLFRSLGFVYDIPGLLRRAYEAGKNGEDFEFEYEEIKED